MNYNNQKKIEFWLLVIIALGLSFSIVKDINQVILQDNNAAETINAFAPEETLKYFYFTKDKSKKPTVSAGSYVVGDLITNDLILAENQNTKFPVASISKLMTAVVTEEISNSKESIQISAKALETSGENGNFRLNEKIKVNEILYPLLLESSNDAAEAIALPYGRNVFIEKMNEKAKELGMNETSFADPSGLSPK